MLWTLDESCRLHAIAYLILLTTLAGLQPVLATDWMTPHPVSMFAVKRLSVMRCEVSGAYAPCQPGRQGCCF